MGKEVDYQEGVLPNLLSGFYEQVVKEKKEESLRIIFAELRKEFTKIRADERKKILNKINEKMDFNLKKETGYFLYYRDIEDLKKFLEIEKK